MSIVKLNNKAVSNATAFGSISSLGSMVFIKKLTASGSSTLSFVDGANGVVLDDTYKEYVFTFNNMHPANNGVSLKFNMSIDGGSNYNVVKTSTAFSSYHNEADTDTNLLYQSSQDLAQSTGDAFLGLQTSNDNDGNTVGTLRLFNPSSSTFVKHYISDINDHGYDYSVRFFGAGYGNTTSPVNAIKFLFSAGNIDAGDICLYGIA